MSRASNQEWRLIRSGPGAGAWNMAVDEALVESVRAGAPPTLRFYEWSPPCLSLGRNQPARGHYDAEALKALGIDVVRRPTGGRAVLHDGEVTYSVAVPDRALGSARQAYQLINQVLAAGLASLGAMVGMATDTTGRSPVPSTVPCFAQPVTGELLAGGRKVVGSAQVRAGGVLLQHGSIPLRPSLHAGAVFGHAESGGAKSADAEHAGAPAYLEEVIGRCVPPAEVVEALAAAWSNALGPLTDGELGPQEYRAAARLTARYADDRWTWRG